MAARRRQNELHFLEANRVEHMAGLEVCTGDNQKLGEIDGIVIDPITHRLKYFVVDPHADNQRCLLPADKPAVLDVEKRELRIEADAKDVERLTAKSEDELIDAIERHDAA